MIEKLPDLNPRTSNGSEKGQAVINMAKALFDRGHEMWDQEQHQEAETVFRRLLSFPNLPEHIAKRARFHLTDVLLGAGKYSDAQQVAAMAIAKNPDDAALHFLMGYALEWGNASRVRDAYKHYRRAAELAAGEPLYSSAYALAHIRMREHRKYNHSDRERLREAFNKAPDDADVVYNYVAGLLEMGITSEAKLALHRALKRWPNHPAFVELLQQSFQREKGGMSQAK